jgi:hypothetical protein
MGNNRNAVIRKLSAHCGQKGGINMANPKENVEKGEKLVQEARQKDKCLDKAKAVEDAISNLKDAAKFTLGEWIAVISAAAY